MNIIKTPIEGLLVIEPSVFRDARGSFYESFNTRDFSQTTCIDAVFVKDTDSSLAHNVLRGLSCQVRKVQGKLVRVNAGEVFDVKVDIRSVSHTFGRWYGSALSAADLPSLTAAKEPTRRMPPPQRITRLKRKGGFGVSAALPVDVPPPMP